MLGNITALDKSSQSPLLTSLFHRLGFWDSESGNHKVVNGRARLGLCHYKDYINKLVQKTKLDGVNGEAALRNKVKYECSDQNYITYMNKHVNQ